MSQVHIHSCSYYCTNPLCIKAQRDELRDKFITAGSEYATAWNSALDEAAARIANVRGFGQATQNSFAAYIKGLKK